MSGEEILRERYGLVMGRIREIPGEHFRNNGRTDGSAHSVGDRYCNAEESSDGGRHSGGDKLEAYFAFCAEFLMRIDDTFRFLEAGGLGKVSPEELEQRDRALYADILPERYEESYGNPAYAVRELGEELGAVLSFLYAELRSLIGFAYESRLEELVIRMELFLEIYTAFVYAADQREEMPSGNDIREVIYWFASDYAELAAERRLGEQLGAEEGAPPGAVPDMGERGLQSVVLRPFPSVLDDWETDRKGRGGSSGNIPNPQFECDHREDKALFLDKNYVNRRLEADRAVCEKWKGQTGGSAVSAAEGGHGEADFQPVPCPEALRLSRDQERLWGEYLAKAEALRQKYMPQEEK